MIAAAGAVGSDRTANNPTRERGRTAADPTPIWATFPAMIHRAARLDGLGTTIFTEMTALAQATGAINLGQGFPDEDGPAAVIDAAVDALRGGHNQYAPLPGVPPLRDAILAHQREHYGLEHEDVLVTFGATEAIASSMLALCEAGRRGRRDRTVLRLLPGGRGVRRRRRRGPSRCARPISRSIPKRCAPRSPRARAC